MKAQSLGDLNKSRQLIIIETSQPQKVKKLLEREQVNYKIYQEPTVEQKTKEQKKIKPSEFQQNLIRGYQAMAKNKKLKKELAAWDETLGDSYK